MSLKHLLAISISAILSGQCDINTSDKPVQISKLVTCRRSNDRHETIHAVSLCTSVVCWVLSEQMTSTMLTIDITLTYKQVN